MKPGAWLVVWQPDNKLAVAVVMKAVYPDFVNY
jgi:hypothetical protein